MSEAENSSGEPPKKKNKSKSDTESKQVDDQEHRTRKISQATRTLKACDLCRRQKTRCIRSDDNRTSCIRCIFLNKPCSLDVDLDVKKSLNESLGVSISNHPMDVGIPNFTSTNNSNTNNSINNKDKIDAIYRMVRELLAVTKNPSTAAIDSKLLIYDPLDSGPLQPLGSTVDNPNRITQSPAKLGGHHHHHQRGRQMLTTSDTVYDLDINFRPMEAIPFTVVNNMRDEINDMPKLITSIFPQWYPFMQFERKPSRKDIITLNILSLNEAIALMNDFRRNYGRWVSFPQNLPTDHLVERIREKSSFLLTTCCVISYRYSPLRMTHKKNYKILMKHLITDFKAALLKNAAMQPHRDGDIEFLQAIVILSIYLHSLSSSITNKYKPFILEDSGDDEDDNLDDEELQEFTLDPWNLSSMGLTTFISRGTLGDSLFGNMKSTTSKSSSYNPGTANDGDDINTNSNTNPEDRIFTFLFDPLESSNEYQKLTVIRLYNHLTLVHLVNCVISGRMCILDDTRLDYCKNTLGLPSSTNFDGRMISEIQILVICYKFIQALLLSTSSEEVEDHYKYTQGEMLTWKGQWEYLFEQPALQFVDFCSNFVQLLVIFNYIYYKLKLEGKFKKNPTNYIPQLGNLDSVLELANMADLAIMYQYALNVVSTIRNIENDAYFAYLSDQIHFFFYFAGIILVKMIECFKLKKVAIDYRPSRSCLKLLTKKFDAVGLNNDLISTYKNGLIQVAKKCNLDLT